MLIFKFKYWVIKHIALKDNLIRTIFPLRIARNEDYMTYKGYIHDNKQKNYCSRSKEIVG